MIEYSKKNNFDNDLNNSNDNWSDRELNKFENKNKKRKLTKKGLFTLGAVAGSLATIGAPKAVELAQEAHTNVQEFVSPQTTVTSDKEAAVKSSAVKGLDQEAIDFDNYELISENEDFIVTIEKGGAVRSTDTDYIGVPMDELRSGPTHTAILQMEEDLDFKLSGDIYQNNETNRLVTRIENFEETADGEATGLKTEIDDDGWVSLDATVANLDQVEEDE